MFLSRKITEHACEIMSYPYVWNKQWGKINGKVVYIFCRLDLRDEFKISANAAISPNKG